MSSPRVDTLITHGRLIDPQHQVDKITTIGVTNGQISYVGEGKNAPSASRHINAEGKIIAPGFIDLHSHAQNLTGHRLQALDGVTTTLELESGAAPIRNSLSWCADQGRPLHYGFSAGWLHSRILVMEGIDDDAAAQLPPLPLDSWAGLQDRTAWRQAADSSQIDRIVETLAAQLDAGGIGIGMLLGYCPDSTPEELEAVAELGAARGVPLWVHARGKSDIGVAELIDVCRRTGVQVHLCHFASTNSKTLEASSQLILDAQAEQLPFTTESYPYGMASTVIGATFLSPEALQAAGTPASNIILLSTGEQIASYDRLAQLREDNPGALVLMRTYDERDPSQVEKLKQALTLPSAAFASDAMPVKVAEESAGEQLRAGDITELDQWPLPAELTVHPRASSCFTKGISWLARDTGTLTLSETIARSSTIPAQILRPSAPGFEMKGHLGLGADADVVVFDLEAMEPATSYTEVTPSRGVTDLLVGGVSVVADGVLQPASCPGRAY